ncbi:hypothetical protein [Actinoplanes sp. NPDC051859]|uniref:hypothetical protein n=1 Tax=Actinoplanes sp. NPDC051859 TaxID=3363909 RepID=UPI0037ADDBB5
MAIAPALAITLGLAGCGLEADPVSVPPRPDVSSLASANGAFVGKYTKVTDPCPTLDGDAAKRLALPAVGKPGDTNIDSLISQLVTCTWGTGVGSVTTLISIDRGQGTPTAEQKTATEFEAEWQKSVAEGRMLAPEQVGGIGDEAYLAVYGDRQNIVLSFRASNARVMLSYGVGELTPASYATAVRKNKPVLISLGQDILDDLT